ncbi:polysaccharide export protein [Alteromonas sediminis]|uniref:Polysaccharide export protein n=1 Tax=Alteromonas sediminis TaxID=2259342 RepID=A0A3N5Y4L4_9ALTE|nr:polysaccharide biosynthesis/export family protein [Alteromonas sediminis]RPJ68520.1 polysaccharide export protein [Alteromonas sediminis]
MKAVYLILLQISVMLISSASADEFDNYRLSVDDEISITVFQEPDMSVQKTRISTTGAISMPLIGQVSVEGLTVEEVEAKVTELLLDGYLKKPNVTVSITEYRPFYINGEVDEPGSYPFRKGLTVEKAVALAGGFTERASKTTIKLVRQGQSTTVEGVALSYAVLPGDVITVSESFF